MLKWSHASCIKTKLKVTCQLRIQSAITEIALGPTALYKFRLSNETQLFHTELEETCNVYLKYVEDLFSDVLVGCLCTFLLQLIWMQPQ